MKKVIIQYDDKLETFENVTKIKFHNEFDVFSAQLYIYQGKKRTSIRVYKIVNFTVCKS